MVVNTSNLLLTSLERAPLYFISQVNLSGVICSLLALAMQLISSRLRRKRLTGIPCRLGTCRPSSVNPKQCRQMELLEPCFIRRVFWLASAAVSDPPNPPKCFSIPWDCSTGLELDLGEGLPPSCIPPSSAGSHGAPASTMGMSGVGITRVPWLAGALMGCSLLSIQLAEHPRVCSFLGLTGRVSGFALSHLLV